MPKILEGSVEGRNLKIAVVASRFNEWVTERLLEGALSELRRVGVTEENILVCKVPGAFEIPVTVKRVIKTSKVDAVVCLGAVIRGETPHFDYVCQAALTGISEISRDSVIPVTNGVITANTVEQAMERSGLKQGNLGADAARAAVEMANLLKRIEG